ncbi:MAG: winged helix-turn-helix domain-containing protein [Methanobacterium sp.]|jgi:DNA-binding HxlR family transcriptional regulator|uniref:Transcriptional regulator n=1 Tax=Methanobacterium subterraneum TaxID=59277 RepID=A0A2H4VMN4_9EURY|nr:MULTISPECIES: winged helix-turn-helix domain-containing protein [Methanobacterium]AUB59316.1 transcriptional regulator [Methanobacterium subterraneum]MCC7560491.1 winged helix-turn-helix domain-containing protein [Methanobacterium sp.]
MDKEIDSNLSKEFLLNSTEGIVTILKAIGNLNRFKILIYLLDGPSSFQMLLDETDLKKSALANHLSRLMNTGLIEKIQHGTYCLTEDGEKYLKTIGNAYKTSQMLGMQITESKKRKNLSMSFLERNKKKD